MSSQISYFDDLRNVVWKEILAYKKEHQGFPPDEIQINFEDYYEYPWDVSQITHPGHGILFFGIPCKPSRSVAKGQARCLSNDTSMGRIEKRFKFPFK